MTGHRFAPHVLLEEFYQKGLYGVELADVVSTGWEEGIAEFVEKPINLISSSC